MKKIFILTILAVSSVLSFSGNSLFAASKSPGQKLDEAIGFVKDKCDDAKVKAIDTYDTTTEKVKESYNNAKDKTIDTYENTKEITKEKYNSATEKAKDKVKDAKDLLIEKLK